MQAGQVRPAKTGLWFSETADIWWDYQGSFGPAKRALYVGILDRGVPLDFIVEQDALDGTLDQYEVLYLTDRHVSRAASEAIAFAEKSLSGNANARLVMEKLLADLAEPVLTCAAH